MLHRQSIHFYLFALVLGVSLPLLAVLAAVLYRDGQREEQHQAEISRQTARVVADETSLLVSDTRSLLSRLALRAAMRSPGGGCDPIFREFGLIFPRYIDLVLWDTQGQPVCSSMPTKSPNPVDSDSLKPILRNAAFETGTPYVSLVGKPSVVVFGKPVVDSDGRPQGVLTTALELSTARPFDATAIQFSPDVVTAIIDDQGRVVAATPYAWLGQRADFRPGKTIDAALREQGVGRLQGSDSDLSWGTAAIAGTSWVAVAGMPAGSASARVQQMAIRDASLVIGLLVLTAVWAWWFGRRLLEPIQGIASLAKRVADGGTQSSPTALVEFREAAQKLSGMLDRGDAVAMELRKSNQTLALVQEASAGGIWEWDILSDRVNCSRRFRALLDFADSDDFQSFSFRENLHPDDRDRVFAALRRHIEHDLPFDEEFQLRCRGGDYKWFRGRGLALRDSSGKAVHFAGSIDDITQRKRTELELRESEERFELAIRASAGGIWDWDIANNGYYISPKYKALLGYRDDELQNSRDTFLDLLHPDDSERVAAAVKAHLENRIKYDIEYRLRSKDGTYRWFRGRGQAVWDASGQPLRMAGSVNDVTDRKITESALRESEAKYRLLLETSTDTVLMVDGNNRIVFANRALTENFGYTPAEVIGKDLSMLQPEYLRDTHRAGMQRFLATGEKRLNWRLVETTALHRDGHEFPVELSFSQLQLGGRSIFASYLRDISGRKNAEAELRRSERLFREMADSVPALIWMSRTDGELFYFNRPWLEFTGRSLDQEIHEGWLDSVHPDDRLRCRRDHFEALAGRRPFRVEYRLLRRDGEYRWLLDQGVPRFDEHGTFIGHLGSCVDITSRVEADDHIRRLSGMYAALSQVNDAIARAKDRQKLFERVCQIAGRFGSFTATLIGLVDEARNCVVATAHGGQSYGYVDHVEVPLDASDPRSRGPVASAILGNRHEVWNDFLVDERSKPWRDTPLARSIRSIAAFPLRHSGRTIGVFAVYSDEIGFFDVETVQLLLSLANNLSYALDSLAAGAQRQRIEEEIRELNATLEVRVQERTLSLAATNNELEAFSYSVSHDLRAPLRSISGFSDILLEGYANQLGDEGRNYLLRVKQASQRMTRLINDLLNLARIARSELQRRVLDLSLLAEEIAAEIRQSDPKRNVVITITPGLTANADPVLMRSVFENLLGNAWKFTGNCAHATIEVGTAEHSGQPVYFVRDNGAGFNMAYADKLFAPFQRLHTEHEFSGTGVGLAIVKRIVHRHNGHIWAEAVEGGGACFYFTLSP